MQDWNTPSYNLLLHITKLENRLGRIAGIINYRANQKWQTKNVRFGFIDFIDDLKYQPHC